MAAADAAASEDDEAWPRSADDRAADVVIDVRGLSMRFQGGRGHAPHVVLDELTLSVCRGEFVAIVGRSGCGKSTLLRLLLGLMSPRAGTIDILGRSPGATKPGDAVLVFQEYARSLLGWRTVAGNVRFGVERLGLSKEEREARAESALRQVGLSEFAHRYPAQLSGGMQQRLQLARAIAAKPRVLMLDEPFGSLDALTRYDLEDQLQELCVDSGITAILVTHDIDEAIYLADRVIVLGGEPASILLDLSVDIPRPRVQHATKSDPLFVGYRAQLVERLMGRPTFDPA